MGGARAFQRNASLLIVKQVPTTIMPSPEIPDPLQR